MTGSVTNVLAAIDIGSSAIRMDVAEVRAGGTLYVLDSLRKGVQLGKDAFTEGYLSEESIRAACSALRSFKKVMDSYGVARYRAVATSALRESSNSDTFLDRVLMSTGLDVEVIDGSEENRLTYSAVVESVRGIRDLEKGSSLLVEIGGGSTDVTLLRGGEPLQSGTFPLGSVRLREEMNRSSGTRDQQLRLLRRQIVNTLANIKRSVALREASSYIAVGGDLRFVARVLRAAEPDGGPWIVSKEEFAGLVETLTRMSVDEVVKKHTLPYLDAETLGPALLASYLLLKETQAQEIIISSASIRAAILQDLAPEEKGQRRRQLTRQTLSAARSLGRKYLYDEGHAERVCELAVLLFDELKAEHGLTDTHRLYLQVASLLHDVGLFISSRAHHKHSYYLISASELFGLQRRELEIIANVARYHRRALPQRSHASFISLDRYERVIVSKLAAILRVANTLDKGQLQMATDLKLLREDDQLVLVAQNSADLTMERVALAGRSDLFNEVFGKKLILREAAKTA